MSDNQKIFILSCSSMFDDNRAVMGLFPTEESAKARADEIVKSSFGGSEYDWNNSGYFTEFVYDYVESETLPMAGSIGMGKGSRSITITMYISRQDVPEWLEDKRERTR